ncbi:MAG: TetR/AcrR family transcriptional regulator [Candidatus Kapaibacterium sp.]|jgi:AcrR family transcriptional regulator|nr:TetR/AcrR family transcriptional regulator [Candidatus Kapabacteria bacterium]
MNSKENKDIEELIQEVAEKHFLQKGYSMANTLEIAKEVGCNQALIHYYYRSKEKLFLKIFENKARSFFKSILMAGNECDTFEESIKQKIEAHFDFLTENPNLPFLVINELITNPKRMESIKSDLVHLPQQIFENLGKDLEKEIEKGNVRQIEAIDLVLMIASLNISLFLAKPILQGVLSMSDDEYNMLLKRRKAENVRIILSSLLP